MLLSAINSSSPLAGQIENKSPFSSPFAISGSWEALRKKIWVVACVIFKAFLGIFLYRINPVLFAIGFITGIVADDKVKGIITKVSNLWLAQTPGIRALTVFASFLSMPVTLATATLIYSSYYGSKISLQAQQRSFRG